MLIRLIPVRPILIISVGLTWFAGTSAHCDDVVPMKVSVVSTTGMPKTIVEKGALWNFGPSALQTYRGWQYAAFWDAGRQVSVARRELPNGVWQCVSLGGYQRTTNINRGKGGPISQGFGDGHEKVAMGISSDGVIHLAFDHHVSTLHYRCTKNGIANTPKQVEWSENLFRETQDNLPQNNRNGPMIDSVTYPNFVRDGDRLSLYLRLNGGSGSADSHLFEYQSGSWIINDPAESKLIDKHWSRGNGTVNAYPHTIFVHNGRRHLTWSWRDTPDARTSHDLCYAYSDDHGETWKNSAGKTVAKRAEKFITADTTGIAVIKLATGSFFVNGGSMTVGETGDVFVLMKGPNGRPMVARRDVATGRWGRSEGSVLGSLVATPSGLLVVSEEGLYRAKESELGTLSRIGESIESLCVDSRFGIDHYRWQHDKTISVIGQNGRRVVVIDFAIGE